MKKILKNFKRVLKNLNKAHLQLLNNLHKSFKTYFNKMRKLLFLITIFISMLIQNACNVTRKVTTEASYYQKGDTTTTIVTKTVETYDAKKNTQNF